MEFQKFNKIPRLSRDCIITEKLDGTNAQIAIFSYKDLSGYVDDTDIMLLYKQSEEFIYKYCLGQFNVNPVEKTGLYIFAGSRKRWLDVSSDGDNFGFAKWVQANAEELLKLGEGRHYGEWFGKGIQRGYGLDEKRFALFNVGKWVKLNTGEELREGSKLQECPKCCDVVPILDKGIFDTNLIENRIEEMKFHGSYAVPGFMNPEGIIIYHTASGQLFKKTIVGDEKPKGQK